MTITSITDAKKLATLKHLAAGKDLDIVATIVALPRSAVLEIGSHHGYPDRDKLAWAADVVEKKIHEADTPPAKQATPTPRQQPIRVPSTAAAAPAPVAAPAPAVLTKPDELRVLLNTAKAHPSKRIQTAADRAFDALDRVRVLIKEDEEKHAARRQAEAEKAQARAEVERLEKQLAAAKAKLRGTQAPTPATTSAGPTAAEIRAWAADNNIDCPNTGRVPSHVREAYDDAHHGDAA